jgi:Leucine-rich repeat (LRR) protein
MDSYSKTKEAVMAVAGRGMEAPKELLEHLELAVKPQTSGRKSGAKDMSKSMAAPKELLEDLVGSGVQEMLASAPKGLLQEQEMAAPKELLQDLKGETTPTLDPTLTSADASARRREIEASVNTGTGVPPPHPHLPVESNAVRVPAPHSRAQPEPGAYAAAPGEGLRRAAAGALTMGDNRYTSTGVLLRDPNENHDLALARPVQEEPVPDTQAQPVDLEEIARQKAAAEHQRKLTLCKATFFFIVFGSIALGLALGRGEKPSGPLSDSPSLSPSMAPTTQLMAFKEYLASILPDTAQRTMHKDRSSPQAMAFQWILQDPNSLQYSPQTLIQRFALATFYFATNDPNDPWWNTTGWMTYDTHECDWWQGPHYLDDQLFQSYVDQYYADDDFIYRQHADKYRNDTMCNDDQMLVHFWIFHNNLKGSIPPEIALLTTLISIDLTENLLTGGIPTQIFTLPLLQTLWIFVNEITGSIPTEIGLASSLIHYAQFNNLMTGTVPTQIGILSNLELEAFQVEFSGMTGDIPSEIGQLKQLRLLYMAYNDLTGTVPTELGLASSISDCHLYVNQLTGTIPTEIANWPNGYVLYWEFNFFTGTMPTQLGRLTNAAELYFGSNLLSGTIPTEIGGQAFTRLTDLSFDYNKLTGSIPTEFCLSPILSNVVLFGNQLTGPLPSEIGLLSALTSLRLSDNLFTGSIPSQWTFSEYFQKFHLDNNHLTGPLPSEIELWANLSSLLLHNNHFTGTIPPLEGLANLKAVDLRNNSFLGSLPEELCVLERSTQPSSVFCDDGYGGHCDSYLAFDCSAGYGNESGRCGCDCPCMSGADATLP